MQLGGVDNSNGRAAEAWEAWKVVMHSCWAELPKGRPSFAELRTALTKLSIEHRSALPPMRDIGALAQKFQNLSDLLRKSSLLPTLA